MPILTNLNELKVLLEIDPNNTSEDTKIWFFVEYASQIILELLNRQNIFIASRTEIYNGTNTPRLVLNSRPVYTSPTIRVWVDGSANYGSSSGAWASNTELTYGEDFCLQVDQVDGTSRSAILVRLKKVWEKKFARASYYLTPFIVPDTGSIKITYTAGYTVDNLPADFRFAVNLLVTKMRYIMPLGMELSNESYEERSISILGQQKGYLTNLVKGIITPYKNWKF